MTGATTSFRWRLAVVTTALCFTLLLMSSVTVFLMVRAALLANLDSTLISVARTEVASVLDGLDPRPHLHQDIPISLETGHSHPVLGLILDSSRKVDAASDAGSGLEASLDPRAFRAALAGTTVMADVEHAGASYRAIYVPLDLAEGPHVEVLAISREPVAHILKVLGAVLLVSLATATTLAGLGSWLLSGRLTRPLRQMVEAAEKVGEEQDLSLRLPGRYQEAELEFVRTRINKTLDLLEELFREKEQWIESRRQLMADISHELRTPLTNLRTALEITLRRPREAAEYRETLQECLSEADRLGHLAEDLLTLSRSELEQLTLERTGVDLSELVRETVCAHSAAAHAARVELEVEADGIELQADQRRLRQVLDNLLSNALAHSPPGGVVRISLARHNGEAVLTMADQGPGISEADRDRVFERFYRADSSRCRATGGAGLGLPLCRALVEAHGGSIVALPSEVGATFAVRLPVD